MNLSFFLIFRRFSTENMQLNVLFTSTRKFDSLYEMMAPMSSTNYLNSVLRLKYTIILKWSFLNFNIIFYNNDDLIVFHFNMEILMVEISFEIIRHQQEIIVATTINYRGDNKKFARLCIFLPKHSFE